MKKCNEMFRCNFLPDDPPSFSDILGRANLPADSKLNDGKHVDEMFGRMALLLEEMDEIEGDWRVNVRATKVNLNKMLQPLWQVGASTFIRL